jgi:hypothetical protein
MHTLLNQTNEELLDALDAERDKYGKANDMLMHDMVDELVNRGVYPQTTPAMVECHYTHFTMVESWGARWHLYCEPHNCPHCNADLRDVLHEPPGNRKIGLEMYDRCVAFICPDCRKAIWEQWKGAADEAMGNRNLGVDIDSRCGTTARCCASSVDRPASGRRSGEE